MMSESTPVKNDEISLNNTEGVTEPKSCQSLPQAIAQPRRQKARKTFPSSCSEAEQFAKQQKLLNFMRTEFDIMGLDKKDFPQEKVVNETMSSKDLPVTLHPKNHENPNQPQEPQILQVPQEPKKLQEPQEPKEAEEPQKSLESQELQKPQMPQTPTQVPDDNKVATDFLTNKTSQEVASQFPSSKISLPAHIQGEEDMDADVMDVEAAIAALHGEVLDDGVTAAANIYEASNEAGLKDSKTLPLGQTNMLLVDTHKDKPPSKKNNRKKRKTHLSSTKYASTKGRSLQAFSASKVATGTPTDPASPAAAKTPSLSANKRKAAARRELNGLFIDEGAIHMLCEMEKRGMSGRRSGSINETACLIPKELLGDKTLKNIRTTRMQRKAPPAKSKSIQLLSPKRSDDDPDSHCFGPSSFVLPVQDMTSAIVASRSFSADPSDLLGKPREMPSKKMKLSHTDVPTHHTLPVRLELQPKEPIKVDPKDIEMNHSESSEAAIKNYATECREIVVRFNEQFVHVILSPKSSTSPDAINPAMLRELTQLLRMLNSHESSRVVLFTSAGPNFCTGIDLALLISDSQSDRLEAANRLARLIKDFVMALTDCEKLLLCGLTGSVIGLGVTMLAYFDGVYASDKATFHLPYVQLGQGTEGGLPLTFRHYAASNQLIGILLYEGRCLTATEAQGYGLVHTVLWPSSFQDDLLCRVHKIASQSTKVATNSPH